MKCPNCGASHLEVFNDSQYRCNYCQTEYAKIELDPPSSPSTPKPVDPDIDFSHYANAIVNILTERGNGTGFVIHERGWVLTNHHVIQDDIIVHGTVGDEPEAYELEVLATGKAMGVDLALLEILHPTAPFRAISPAQTPPKIGDMAATIGHPKNLGISLSKGYVSRQTDTILQLDLTVNAGNSGGPVLNHHGECIGIISYKQSDVDGYGFAVPLKKIKMFLAEYRAKESL